MTFKVEDQILTLRRIAVEVNLDPNMMRLDYHQGYMGLTEELTARLDVFLYGKDKIYEIDTKFVKYVSWFDMFKDQVLPQWLRKFVTINTETETRNFVVDFNVLYPDIVRSGMPPTIVISNVRSGYQHNDTTIDSFNRYE